MNGRAVSRAGSGIRSTLRARVDDGDGVVLGPEHEVKLGDWSRIANSNACDGLTRIESAALREELTQLTVGGQCVGLTTRSVEGDHELAPEDSRGGGSGPAPRSHRWSLAIAAAQGEIGVDPAVRRGRPEVFQPGDVQLAEPPGPMPSRTGPRRRSEGPPSCAVGHCTWGSHPEGRARRSNSRLSLAPGGQVAGNPVVRCAEHALGAGGVPGRSCAALEMCAWHTLGAVSGGWSPQAASIRRNN